MMAVLLINTTINALYLLTYQKDSILIFISAILLESALLYFLKRNLPLKEINIILLSLLILSIPTSFVNIFNGNFGKLPLSWYNLYFILIFFWWLAKSRKVIRGRFMIALPFSLWLLFAVINSYDKLNALKDFINFIPLIFFYVAVIRRNTNSQCFFILIDLYIISALSLFIPLVVQIFSFVVNGIILGKVAIYSNRIAFGATFSDFSFLSLFFATASLMAFLRKGRTKSLLLIVASILTSARTGIVSLISTLGLLGIPYYLRRGKVLNSAKIILLFMTVLVIFFLIFPHFRGENLFDATGRLKSFEKSLALFFEKPLSGVGLGTESFKKNYGFTIPHNLIIQMLLQTGIIGLIFLVVVIVDVYRAILGKIMNDIVLFPLTTTLMGSAFIPDIMNSRFLPILVLLSSLFALQKKEIG